ncbi:hypothetical protein TrVE_jg1100 [Triparma verrucosa]|uniref:Uncharacterized protein n=1 Tax=Triparma verrucosa TaxID=1606542 RepID=A0A9W7FQ94_9STRA|nr:hypothetical protein TrVE_jg1100 [Triparma verrucosa]
MPSREVQLIFSLLMHLVPSWRVQLIYSLLLMHLVPSWKVQLIYGSIIFLYLSNMLRRVNKLLWLILLHNSRS